MSQKKTEAKNKKGHGLIAVIENSVDEMWDGDVKSDGDKGWDAMNKYREQVFNSVNYASMEPYPGYGPHSWKIWWRPWTLQLFWQQRTTELPQDTTTVNEDTITKLKEGYFTGDRAPNALEINWSAQLECKL